MLRKTDAAETRHSAGSADPDPLDNYRDLLARVDNLCRTITGEFAAQLACRPGCAGCCRHISLFPVEAVALAVALGRLPVEQAATIRARAGGASPDGPCPLLANGLCLLYEARPIICRTHGLPLLTALEGKRSVDFCPLNFRGLDSLPGSAVIDLDRLNTTLAAINALFVAEFFSGATAGKERLSIAEALRLEL